MTKKVENKKTNDYSCGILSLRIFDLIYVSLFTLYSIMDFFMTVSFWQNIKSRTGDIRTLAIRKFQLKFEYLYYSFVNPNLMCRTYFKFDLLNTDVRDYH